ncbi:hypothetical protein SK854_13500 [Lentzea sp. BCCO 10_0061]|uniref:Uncharacterized protein n=1 Tax=Lentzea sokolovensis TaxID=3095429 RepID=A0ABU4UUF4_9PSEU|nr:hypothetical protein [Lentzea sp. BCCO 10_0061]MDX8143137.1 hypothetical protein [Lentzea sp. BCCO 10_0061]
MKNVLRRLLPVIGMLAVAFVLVYTNSPDAIEASRFWISVIEQSGPLN